MKRKNIVFIVSVALLVIILGVLIFNKYLNRSRLIELNVEQVIEKVENKDSFVICISSTDCSHCQSYKPKLDKISKKYDLEIFYIDIDKYSDDEQNKFRNYISFDNSTPVTAFIKEGEETTTSNRLFGNTSSDKIIKKLKNNGFIK